MPAFTLPPLPSNVAALLVAAAAGTLSVETVTLRPGTTTSDPNRWVIFAVTRLRFFQERDGPDYRKNWRSDAAIVEDELQAVADWWKGHGANMTWQKVL